MNVMSVIKVRLAKTLLLGLLGCLSLASHVEAACSAYQGKVVFNEVSDPASGTTFVEVKVLDPSVITATSGFQGWKVALYQKNVSTGTTQSATTDLSSAFTDTSLNNCGQSSAWIRVPDSLLSNYIHGSNPGNNLNFVLYDTAQNQIIDILRMGSASSFYGAGSNYASCATIESALPSAMYDAAWGSTGNKDWFRDPDGTGPWGGQSTTNNFNTACGSNNGGGAFSLTKTASVSTVATNTNFTFTLYAQNGATGTALSGVQITDDLNAAGLTFVSCTTANGTCTNSGGVVTWNIGAVAVSSQKTATLTVKATSGGTKINTITANTTSSPTATATVTVTGASGPDHLQIEYPGDGLTCAPSTVTVKACANATCSTPYSGGVTGTLSPGGAAYTIGATGSTTSTVSSTTSPATLSASASPAVINTLTCLNTVTSSTSCSMTFNNAGFIFSSAANGAASTIPAQVAGTSSITYYLRAVQTSTTTKACEAALAGANTVNMAYQCNNPTTCNATNLMSINGGTATTIAGNPNTGVSTYTSVPLTFDANGNAPLTFNYSDVGQVTLLANKTVSSVTLTGSSNAFVVKPGGFVISGIKQTASPQLVNPAAASAGGSIFVKAGESFTATVTATTSGGVATPNYGKESPAASAEGVLLTPGLVLPSGGSAGTVSNATIAGSSFTNGVATVTNLAWSEVGIITLTPSVGDGSYLGEGNVTGTTTGNVGRFYPDHFAISSASLTAACTAGTAFTYFGEDGFTTAFTLTAQNLSGGTTSNYTGAFAKLGLTTYANYGFTAATLPAGSSLSSSATAPSGNWANGVATVSAKHQISRPTALTGETLITVSAAPTDGEVPAGTATALGSATRLRYGRLQLQNAYGSELLALPVTLRAQYWNGSAWVTNADDSCTVLPISSITMGNYLNQLSACKTLLTPVGNVTLTAGSLPGAGLVLTKPGMGNSGSVDLAVNVTATPAGNTCVGPTQSAATAGNLPWFGPNLGARATFGIYKSRLIYSRENY